MAKKGMFREMNKYLEGQMASLSKVVRETLGPMGEPVSPAEQMGAWKARTPEKIAALTEKHGTKMVRTWIREMSRREALSARR